MIQKENITIMISAEISAPLDKVWDYWTGAEHIVRWNCPSPEWYTPRAVNDLAVGGKFVFRMEARDGSAGFDFEGRYENIEFHKSIDTLLGDGRVVNVEFSENGGLTTLVQKFEAENENPVEMQRAGWQGILDNFKKYCEQN